jgi:flagellin-like hook-associated protein FlgL
MYSNIVEDIQQIKDELKQLREEMVRLRYELFNSVNYLMKKEIEREPNIYNSTNLYSDEETTEESEISCGCGKPPQKPCQEIEDYLNSINKSQIIIDMTDSE